jgi:hypothetical protein
MKPFVYMKTASFPNSYVFAVKTSPHDPIFTGCLFVVISSDDTTFRVSGCVTVGISLSLSSNLQSS